jgi:hypothetical protein
MRDMFDIPFARLVGFLSGRRGEADFVDIGMLSNRAARSGSEAGDDFSTPSGRPGSCTVSPKLIAGTHLLPISSLVGDLRRNSSARMALVLDAARSVVGGTSAMRFLLSWSGYY